MVKGKLFVEPLGQNRAAFFLLIQRDSTRGSSLLVLVQIVHVVLLRL